jgi:hypothetical protein
MRSSTDPHPPAMSTELDARPLNWRFIVPDVPPGLLLLPVGEERLTAGVIPDWTGPSLSSALGEGPYPAVAAPDLSRWGGLVGGPAGLLLQLAASVREEGWLCTGFSNPWSPIRSTGHEPLSLGKARRVLRRAGFSRIDTYLAFPDHRRPAYLMTSGGAELGYFLRRFFFPYVGELRGLRARLKQRALRLMRVATLATPHHVRVRFAPSYMLVARR